MGMVVASSLVLAPAPTSGLIRLRSGHHYEVQLGLGIIFMYNMSILEAFWAWGWWLPPPWDWPVPADIWAKLCASGHH